MQPVQSAVEWSEARGNFIRFKFDECKKKWVINFFFFKIAIQLCTGRIDIFSYILFKKSAVVMRA